MNAVPGHVLRGAARALALGLFAGAAAAQEAAVEVDASQLAFLPGAEAQAAWYAVRCDNGARAEQAVDGAAPIAFVPAEWPRLRAATARCRYEFRFTAAAPQAGGTLAGGFDLAGGRIVAASRSGRTPPAR